MKQLLGREFQRGYTFVELLVSIGIIGTLLGIVTINLVRAQSNASVTATVDRLIADMREQQTKAMVGSNDGTGNGNSYGIYFLSDRYILFEGTSYNSSNSANFTVSPSNGSILTNITFPGSTLIFSQQSGEVSGFTQGSNTVTIQSASGSEQKTLTVNRYGTVVTIQ